MTADGAAPGTSEADRLALARAKTVLRRAVRQRRQARPENQRRQHDLSRFAVVRDQLTELAERGADCVACYLSSAPEPDTRRVIGWLAAARLVVLLPVLTPTADDQISEPDWARYAGPDQLENGPHGLVQPTTSPLGPAALGLAQLIIVPALAASRRGQRLGRGGGWYDRALSRANHAAVSVALLNDDELLDVIPCHSWDRRVDAVATPQRWIDCG